MAISETRVRKVVVTLHGIRTHGTWQKEITPYLAREGLIPYHLDYGWFSVLGFLIPLYRNRKLAWLRRELRDLLEKAQCDRVSFIAHSFGTYLLAAALEAENGDLRYDRVVLTGSILRRDFDWARMREKGWVIAVRNERATRDWVVRLAALASRVPFLGLRAGASGLDPFQPDSPFVIERSTEGGHSEVHNPLEFQAWARFIAFPGLPDDLLSGVADELSLLRQTMASFLNVSASLVRTNLFAPYGSKLRIVPGAVDNMLHAPELSLEITRGHGATGTAFEKGEIGVSIRSGDHWSAGHLPAEELERLNPRLRWVISVPVFGIHGHGNPGGRNVVAVAHIDGLDRSRLWFKISSRRTFIR